MVVDLILSLSRVTGGRLFCTLICLLNHFVFCYHRVLFNLNVVFPTSVPSFPS